MRGSYQPFSSWKSITNMWSVKTVPKVRSLSFGFCFFTVACVIRIGSDILLSLTRPMKTAHLLRWRPRLLPAAYAAYASVGPRAPPRIWAVLIGRCGVIRACRNLLSSAALKDDRFAIQPEHLAVDVGDFSETHVILHRVDQHGHHVVLIAACFGQLLESSLDLAAVAGSFEAPDALDLLVLDGR